MHDQSNDMRPVADARMAAPTSSFGFHAVPHGFAHHFATVEGIRLHYVRGGPARRRDRGSSGGVSTKLVRVAEGHARLGDNA